MKEIQILMRKNLQVIIFFFLFPKVMQKQNETEDDS